MTGDEVGHGRRVIGRLFSLRTGEEPVFGLGVAHGRHPWFDTEILPVSGQVSRPGSSFLQ